MKIFPPTALETPDCPPHYWKIDIGDKFRDGMGICLKCQETRDFSGNGYKVKVKKFHRDLMCLKCSKGGRSKRKGDKTEYNAGVHSIGILERLGVARVAL